MSVDNSIKEPLLNLSGYHHAARGSQIGVSVWLSLNENINARDSWGRNAAHWAADCDNLPVLMELALFGIDLNSQDKRGNTPLHIAAKKGRLLIITFLFCQMVKHVRDAKGRYPLHVATYEAFEKMVLLGANLNVIDSEGKTPFEVFKKRFTDQPPLKFTGFIKTNFEGYTKSL